MSRLASIVLAAISLAFVHGGFAAAPSGHVDAYVLMIKAEQAERQGELREAIGFYEQGVAKFIEVTQSQPDWQPELVRYRIAHSQNQIARLRALIDAVENQSPADGAEPASAPPGGQAATPEAAPPTAATAPDTRDEEIQILEDGLQKLEADNLALRQKVRDLEGKVEEAERRGADAQEAAAAHAAEISALKEQLQQTASQAATIDQIRIEAEQARESAKGEQVKYSEAEKRIASLEAERQALGEAVEEWRKKHDEVFAALNQKHEAARAAESNSQVQVDRMRGELLAAGQQIEQQEELLAGKENELLVVRAEMELLKQESAADAGAALSFAEATNELERVRKELARVQQEFESAVKLNQQYDKQKRELEDERNRLVARVKDGQKVAEAPESERVAMLRQQHEALEEENSQLKREIDGLNHTIDRIQQKNATAKLREQNSALIEEVRVLRVHAANLEKQIKDKSGNEDPSRAGN